MLGLNEASSTSRRVKVCEGNLALLREKLSRDPESYNAEFTEQHEHFRQQMELIELQPHQQGTQLDGLLRQAEFLSATAQYYSEQGQQLGAELYRSLCTQSSLLDPALRLALCKAAVRLASVHLVDLLQQLVPLFFQLLRCSDKQLRKFILLTLVSIVRGCTKGKSRKQKRQKGRKNACKKKRNQKNISAALRQLLFSALDSPSAVCARVAQMVLAQAYRRQYWREPKTANALAQCVFHRVSRIQVSSMRFLLGITKGGLSVEDEEGEDDSSEEEDKAQSGSTLREVMQQVKHAKKTKKRQKQVDRVKKVGRETKKKGKDKKGQHCDLEAIRSIYDPQKFADQLFARLNGKKNEKYAIRLLQIALCARLIGVHRLQTLGFYSYLHRYLQPRQREVSRLLLYAAQACHPLVPPDVVEQLVRVVAQNFVTDRNTSEAITVGLNTIREIYANCPAAATEEMVRDLADYKKIRNKNVTMAARALISHLRTLNPKLLHHKDRGRPNETAEGGIEMDVAFGQLAAIDHVPGAGILPEEQGQGEEGEYKGELEDEDEEGEGEWMDVESCSDGGSEETEEEQDGEEGSEEEEEEEEDMDTAGGGEYGNTKPMTKSQKRANKLAEMENKLQLAKQISESRILTDNDFRLIRVEQLRQRSGIDRNLKRKKTNDELLLEEELREKSSRKEEGAGLPRLDDIEHFRAKLKRQSKEERMEQVKKGREGRQEYGKPKKTGAHVGRTNRELAKRKNFQMVRHKMRGKNRQRSFRDRQISLRNYLLRQQGKKV